MTMKSDSERLRTERTLEAVYCQKVFMLSSHNSCRRSCWNNILQLAQRLVSQYQTPALTLESWKTYSLFLRWMLYSLDYNIFGQGTSLEQRWRITLLPSI